MNRRLDSTVDDDGDAPPRAPARPAPTLLLAFASEGRRRNERHLLRDGVVLGREPLVFPGGPLDDDRLSRAHAEVKRHGRGYAVADLGSRNGTWVNGVRLQRPHPLVPGDLIRVGGTLILYAAFGDSADASIAASLVGPSDALSTVRRGIAAHAVGPRPTVLVTGESGTGKELVAAAIHEASGRAGKLVAVNCGALAEGTVAGELFGHVRGAFTDASADRPGLFRSAHRGTLFLDEVGEIPPALQPHLLRAIETRQVRPVGGTEDVAVDVAIVAATNRDLIAEVRGGRFRGDLYARLARAIVHVPPLRERREDIPALVDHLLARCGAGGRAMAAALAEALLLHGWPLNVRELFNVLSTAVQSQPGSEPLALTPEVERALAAGRALAAAAPDEEAPSRETLEAALARARGKVAAAARQLGCSRQQLYRWAARHGLDPSRFRG